MKLYECNSTGEIHICPYPDEPPAQFCIVKKYEVFYAEEAHRFHLPHAIYALPFKSTPEKYYYGVGRVGRLKLDEDRLNASLPEQEARCIRDEIHRNIAQLLQGSLAAKYLSFCTNAADHEIIFVRAAGSDHPVPADYRFAGYDVSYLPDQHGAFSIINDCLFVCEWIGCDEEGTEFIAEFDQLNANGLFPTQAAACAYMVHYLNQEWSERGDYVILEIYLKDHQK